MCYNVFYAPLSETNSFMRVINTYYYYYLEVFFRNFRVPTERYFFTAILATYARVTFNIIGAGSEIIPPLHSKSRPSFAIQCDEI